jgi:hypothetical protein
VISYSRRLDLLPLGQDCPKLQVSFIGFQSLPIGPSLFLASV